MSHQDQSRERETHADHAPHDVPRPPRVLSIGLDGEAQDALDRITDEFHNAPEPDTCWEWLNAGDFDALVIGPDLERSRAILLASRIAGSDLATRPVFADPDPSVTFSVDAMRSGAVDLIRPPIQT